MISNKLGSFSISTHLCMNIVASQPSSRIIFGPPSKSRVCLRHHQYSSRLSHFHAKTGIQASAIAAAA